jgi:hypothetical protein
MKKLQIKNGLERVKTDLFVFFDVNVTVSIQVEHFEGDLKVPDWRLNKNS